MLLYGFPPRVEASPPPLMMGAMPRVRLAEAISTLAARLPNRLRRQTQTRASGP